MAQDKGSGPSEEQKSSAVYRARKFVKGRVATCSNERFALACEAQLESSQRYFKSKLERELRWLKHAYKLEESQLKHLRLAIVGAQKQHYKSDVDRVTDARTAVDKGADDVRPELIALFKDICATNDVFEFDSTLKCWQNATKKVLTESQHDEYVREFEERRKFQKEVHLQKLVWEQDHRMRLRSWQRDELLRMLRESPRLLMFNGYGDFPVQVQRDFKKLLTETQLQILRNKIEPF